jgi:hypothetical protein
MLAKQALYPRVRLPVYFALVILERGSHVNIAFLKQQNAM